MSDAVFHRALQGLLTEVFDGPPGKVSFILNPGDPGLLRQLESVDATVASGRPMAGQTTIAAHVDHVLYGIGLLNDWADGDPNPWATADWNASWQRTKVTEPEWRDLLARLRMATETLQRNVRTRTDWNEVSAAGALASAAHTAYHLGAIRQLLAAQSMNHAPR